ncbi:hypothetical protein [Altererythrobacter sp. GH1-8]|uniref:hypothetical protein n=1 Tax=Altererythrobacter sp. GH1-8 TaxID=3349333 RepID=UPI00374DCD6D
METASRALEAIKFDLLHDAGFNHNEIFATKGVPSGQQTQEKDAGAEEIVMIGVQLPVTALAKAMALSGLMWAAIVYQAVIWLS